MTSAPRPLLVTGGAGFIGCNFVRHYLAEERTPLVNLDKLTYAGHLESLGAALDSPRHQLIAGDVADLPLLRSLFEEHRPGAVVHLAAETHVDRSIDQPAEFFETNIRGTFCLLEAACAYWRNLPAAERATFRLLHVSTDEVYGDASSDTEFNEDSPYRPNSPYAASKAAADHLVRAYFQTYGLPVVITNCSNNYGPFQTPEKLIPLMIARSQQRLPLPIYGDGQQVREWLHVEDHVRALRRVLDAGRSGETYLIGSGVRLTNLELVERICALVEALRPAEPGAARSPLEYVTDRPGHDRRYALDSGKIRRELGWRPAIDFAAGLQQTVAWYLKNTAWLAQAAARLPQDRIGLGQQR